MSILSSIDPALQGIIVALMVKLVQELLAKMDKLPTNVNGVAAAQVILVVANALSTVAGLYLQHKLGTLDVSTLVSIGIAWLTSLGSSKLGRDMLTLIKGVKLSKDKQ